MLNTGAVVLGGGIAGLSFASFFDGEGVVLERDKVVGGLSRSYNMNGIAYDVGPHIIFSKNKEVLDMHTSIIPTAKIRRSNQIFHQGRYVKYPFENDLAKLDAEERDYCLREFLSNPYENYPSGNMLQFFLKTFGEGITRTYLQPYNEKIWKFDPSCMDTQMVERIPKPPREDVIKSAAGESTEGYLHQLYFHYPEQGGFQTLVDAYAKKAAVRSKVLPSTKIEKLEKSGSGPNSRWTVTTNQGQFSGDRLVNCMPVHELFKYLDAPADVCSSLAALKYNSIHIIMLQLKKDKIGDHFAIYFADKSIVFHRLSKLNFLGSRYCLPNGGSTLMAEVTFRPDSYLASLSAAEIDRKTIEDLERIGFIEKGDLIAAETRTFKYAYVIYDLDHRRNTDKVLGYLRENGIRSVGRFAEFEYLNTDGVVERTLKLAREFNEQPLNRK